MATLQNVIGLFGTVGDSKWRDPVIARLEREGIPYFNPVVDKWTPECAPIEAKHLATDSVILFVITGETESFGGLAETGWAALSAMKNRQTVLFVVQDHPGDRTTAPNRTRELVRTHAKKAGARIYETIDEAVDAAIAAFHTRTRCADSSAGCTRVSH